MWGAYSHRLTGRGQQPSSPRVGCFVRRSFAFPTLATGANSGYKVRCHTAERAKDWKKDLLYRSCKKDK